MKQHHDHGHKRVKDQHTSNEKFVEGLSPRLKGLYNELYEKFPSLRLTSGKRGGDEHSHHSKGDAIDFGRENYDVYNYLYNTTEGLQLMDKYQVGILDETDPETLAKTGGTGKHFHLGVDSGLYQRTKNRLKAGEGRKIIHSYISQNPGHSEGVNVPKNTNFGDKPKPADEIQRSVGGIDIIVPNDPVGQAFLKDVQTAKNVNKHVEDKRKRSPARQRINDKLVERQQSRDRAMEAVKRLVAEDRPQEYTPPAQPYQLPEERVDIDIQTDLPQLPTIFRT